MEWAVISAVALIVVANLLELLWGQAFSPWSGTRLAFASGVVHGIDLYPTARAGVITGDMYGPVAALFYLPALLAPGITPKIVAGETLSTLAMVVPALSLIYLAWRGSDQPPARVLACSVLCVGLLLLLPSTSWELRLIHADAPCLGFGLWSYALLRSSKKPSVTRLALAALLVTLAMLAKPHGAFVALAEIVLLARSSRLRTASIYALSCAALGALSLVLLVHAMGSTLEGFWFNTMLVPSRHPIVSAPRLLLGNMGRVLLPLLVLGAVCLLPWLLQRDKFANVRSYPWPPVALELWFIAFALIPISFLGLSKLGGFMGAMHAHYYAAAATFVVLVRASDSTPLTAIRYVALVAMAVLLFPTRTKPGFGQGPGDPERIVAYLRAHPRVYFPWHPLETLEATGQYFNHPDGLYCLDLARLAPSREAFLTGAPASPELIVMPRLSRLDLVTRYYPEYVPLPSPPEALASIELVAFAHR